MRNVRVTELRQKLAAFIREVNFTKEPIVITEHGAPVALLSPLPKAGWVMDDQEALQSTSEMDRILSESEEVPCDISGLDPKCWVYRPAMTSANGYGTLGKQCPNGERQVHRVAYASMRHPIPFGLELDHLCMNKACWNPWHTEPVTHVVNVRRAVEAKYGPRPVKSSLCKSDTRVSTLYEQIRDAVQHDPEIGVRQLARKLGRNPGNVHRVLKRLTAAA